MFFLFIFVQPIKAHTHMSSHFSLDQSGRSDLVEILKDHTSVRYPCELGRSFLWSEDLWWDLSSKVKAVTWLSAGNRESRTASLDWDCVRDIQFRAKSVTKVLCYKAGGLDPEQGNFSHMERVIRFHPTPRTFQGLGDSDKGNLAIPGLLMEGGSCFHNFIETPWTVWLRRLSWKLCNSF